MLIKGILGRGEVVNLKLLNKLGRFVRRQNELRGAGYITASALSQQLGYVAKTLSKWAEAKLVSDIGETLYFERGQPEPHIFSCGCHAVSLSFL